MLCIRRRRDLALVGNPPRYRHKRLRMTQPQALIFDVFGTLVDWHGSIRRELQTTLVKGLGLQLDAAAMATAWRAQYQPAMQEIRSGQRAFCDLDVLHRRNLDVVLNDAGVRAAVDEATRQHLVRAWHRLQAWPEVGEALALLRQRFLLAPCSNGHIALMVALARHNAWHWDAVLGAELARDYKPQPIVYTTACRALGLAPAQVMMVACHSSDLAAAAAAGLQCGFIARPEEGGPGVGETAPACAVQAQGQDLLQLARCLLARA